jgi:predicted transcriptional regulator of viral defense system
MQYLSSRKTHGVLYRTINGTYDVVEVRAGEGAATWPVVANRDWFKDARILAEEFDAAQ